MMDDVDLMQERADAISTTVEFLLGDITPDEDQTIRAMIVLGGSDDQIVRSVAIAAVNTNVDRLSKGRYAYGCLKNIMLEDGSLPTQEELDARDDYEPNFDWSET